MIQPGTRIRFLHTITEDADGDHPSWLLAEKGERGTVEEAVDEVIIKNRRKAEMKVFHYSVKWDGFTEAAFYANEGEDFEVCKCQRCGDSGIASSAHCVKSNLYSNYPCPECQK